MTHSNSLHRLAAMAGVLLSESSVAAPKIKTIKIDLSHVGMDDQPAGVVSAFVNKAIEAQEILTINTWYKEGKVLVFVPELTDGEVSVSTASQFRQVVSDFLSDPDNLDYVPESVKEAAGKFYVYHKVKGDRMGGADYDHESTHDTREGADAAAKALNSKKGQGFQSYVVRTTKPKVEEGMEYDDEGNPIPEEQVPQEIVKIAQQFGFPTLETRNSDSLDFHELSAAGFKSALMSAYNLGKGSTGSSPTAQPPAPPPVAASPSVPS